MEQKLTAHKVKEIEPEGVDGVIQQVAGLCGHGSES